MVVQRNVAEKITEYEMSKLQEARRTLSPKVAEKLKVHEMSELQGRILPGMELFAIFLNGLFLDHDHCGYYYVFRLS